MSTQWNHKLRSSRHKTNNEAKQNKNPSLRNKQKRTRRPHPDTVPPHQEQHIPQREADPGWASHQKPSRCKDWGARVLTHEKDKMDDLDFYAQEKKKTLKIDISGIEKNSPPAEAHCGRCSSTCRWWKARRQVELWISTKKWMILELAVTTLIHVWVSEKWLKSL